MTWHFLIRMLVGGGGVKIIPPTMFRGNVEIPDWCYGFPRNMVKTVKMGMLRFLPIFPIRPAIYCEWRQRRHWQRHFYCHCATVLWRKREPLRCRCSCWKTYSSAATPAGYCSRGWLCCKDTWILHSPQADGDMRHTIHVPTIYFSTKVL